MKIGITAVLAAAALAAATGAQAQEDNERGFYAGAGVGSFSLDIDNPGDIGDAFDRYSSDDTAWKAFVGYRINPYLAAEIGYVNLGSPDDTIATDTKLTVETDGIAPYIVGTLPIGDVFEAFAKAGYYWYDVNTRLTGPGTVIASDTTSDSTFVWSAGFGADIFDHINVRLEYEQFDFNDADSSNALWLTGAWRF